MPIEVECTRRLRVGENDNLLVDCRLGLKKNETITVVTSEAPAVMTQGVYVTCY